MKAVEVWKRIMKEEVDESEHRDASFEEGIGAFVAYKGDSTDQVSRVLVKRDEGDVLIAPSIYSFTITTTCSPHRFKDLIDFPRTDSQHSSRQYCR